MCFITAVSVLSPQHVLLNIQITCHINWCFRHTIQVWDLAHVVKISVWSQKLENRQEKKKKNQTLQHNVFSVISDIVFIQLQRRKLIQKHLLIADCVYDGLEEVISRVKIFSTFSRRKQDAECWLAFCYSVSNGDAFANSTFAIISNSNLAPKRLEPALLIRKALWRWRCYLWGYLILSRKSWIKGHLYTL